MRIARAHNSSMRIDQPRHTDLRSLQIATNRAIHLSERAIWLLVDFLKNCINLLKLLVVSTLGTISKRFFLVEELPCVEQ